MKQDRIEYIITPLINPFSGIVYEIRYYLARYKGNMKNGRKIIINLYSPIWITKDEKQNLSSKKIYDLFEKRSKKAEKDITNRIRKYILTDKRIGLPGHKGRFYFLNPESVINE